MKINGETQIIGFFGSTYRKSKMYEMYNQVFSELNLNYIYIPFVVNNLEKAITGVRNLGIKALGVTVPYKIEITKYLDEIYDDAKEIGAVNFVLNENGKLKGGNTDGKGAVKALKEKIEINGKNILLLGAGGAGRAIAFAIAKEKGNITILNRLGEKSKELAKAVNCKFGILNDLDKEVKRADIIINATPIGMNENESLINGSLLSAEKTVMDLITVPKETKLLRDAKQKGCTIIYGERMLLWQAVLKFKIFTGFEPPVKIMENSLKEI